MPVDKMPKISGDSAVKPIFVTGWWSGLTNIQRLELNVFLLLYFIVLFNTLYILAEDEFFIHGLKLSALRKQGFPDQPVRYHLEIVKRIGFHTNHNEVTDYILPMKLQLSANTTYPDESLENVFVQQLQEVKQLWRHCVRQTHRARSFRITSQLTLIMAIMGLFSAPAMFVLNRIWMIRQVSVSIQLVIMAFLLHYATSLEYHACLEKVNENPQSNENTSPRYEITLLMERSFSNIMSATFVLCCIPMLFVGIDLIWSDNKNL
ncbi:hypothetical protein PHET_05274 [Paragonimus heterotremus]|uniref:Uncharacterized protein n=1 Tax=Paragonimus heterotremus TaxID=100268 RepID=A0A8J4T8D7_9TREM|nr:hypothetical protein PHET_05274 [Paragonimus heterotremus]